MYIYIYIRYMYICKYVHGCKYVHISWYQYGGYSRALFDRDGPRVLQSGDNLMALL